MSVPFDLQGHRGARGLKPENTLPAFEAAFDLGVTTVETDIHLTRDLVPLLVHDPVVSERLCRLVPGATAPDPATRPAIASLTLAELQSYRADLNPNPQRFPQQDAAVTSVAGMLAVSLGINPYAPPALRDLFAFAEAYAGEPGARAGKTDAQRAQARRVRFDLEIKRVPFRPEIMGGTVASGESTVEQLVVTEVRRAGLVARSAVRSFDHRSVRLVRQLEPALLAVVLIAGTAPIAPEELVRHAEAQGYAPEYEFLDQEQVHQLHAAGLKVVPWTINEPADWDRLLDWGVDGITTDFPDQLAALLRARGIDF